MDYETKLRNRCAIRHMSDVSLKTADAALARLLTMTDCSLSWLIFVQLIS